MCRRLRRAYDRAAILMRGPDAELNFGLAEYKNDQVIRVSHALGCCMTQMAWQVSGAAGTVRCWSRRRRAAWQPPAALAGITASAPTALQLLNTSVKVQHTQRNSSTGPPLMLGSCFHQQ